MENKGFCVITRVFFETDAQQRNLKVAIPGSERVSLGCMYAVSTEEEKEHDMTYLLISLELWQGNKVMLVH